MEGRVEIQVNGERRQVGEGMTVLSLLRELSLPETRVAVERNLSLVRKTEFADTVLGEGDRIEIVTFVGGG
jgi:thiamine biosynthesis protein ThiS